jgi:hypothetical protein
MSRFTENLRVIPRTAWVIAIVAYLVFANLAFFLLVPTDPEMMRWPREAQWAFSYGVFWVIGLFVLLIGFVYGDAKRRGMRYILWTLLAIFVPYMIGIILYFILRSPLPKPCPSCSLLGKPGFTFCPFCGSPLRPTCTNCGRALELGWAHCVQCGTKVPSGTTQAA